ncbi:hypothetical protein APS56_12705 [Pseudalgibacter alginicilyticus]|uniref:DUF5123 domain-containing protein n=1 Tax=Pseudalgibacter alginicilyticus TaxID=1736674 RepID=A0A0P0CID9_9FLAO|nr:DUF5123 domain-containing protein [Pseudalgibacter alginicilyticus]ALJ05938.1 hypothetical protein APS56_12705 [Pseudalgibacter alginicilyticus]
MKNKKNIFNIKTVIFMCLVVAIFNACDKDNDETFEKTRLFRPVLNEELTAEGNTIIVNMGKLKEAVGYTIEVSRDTFATIEYTVKSDDNYLLLDSNTVGEELFWNTLYQVRSIAHSSDSQYDSKYSDLGNVRTERFPSILNVPTTNDVIDVAARVSWSTENSGAAVTGIKVFSADDLRLETPLFSEISVSPEEQEAGESFVYGLDPETIYQIGIYSGEELRGWVKYTTRVPDIDPNGPNVIDIRDNEYSSAVLDAMYTAPDNSVILVKRGVEYAAPTISLDKSITIRAAYGFGDKKAQLLFSGSFDLVEYASVNHLRFVDLELRSTNWDSKYLLDLGKRGSIGEVNFENCYITNFRGVLKIKAADITVDNYIINNSIVDSINGYGIAGQDHAGSVLNNIKFSNSTINRAGYFIISRNNSKSIIVEDCTIANILEVQRPMFRYRQSGQDNVTDGIIIRNCIIGHAWDRAGDGTTAIRGTDGLEDTFFNTPNNYTVSDFSWEAYPILTLPVGNAGITQEDLWEDPDNNNFTIKNSGFIGKYDTGDPRWRVQL